MSDRPPWIDARFHQLPLRLLHGRWRVVLPRVEFGAVAVLETAD